MALYKLTIENELRASEKDIFDENNKVTIEVRLDSKGRKQTIVRGLHYVFDLKKITRGFNKRYHKKSTIEWAANGELIVIPGKPIQKIETFLVKESKIVKEGQLVIIDI